MRLTIRLALAASALTLGSCANPTAERAVDAQRALVGMPKGTLLSCAGVPERQASAEGREYFTYSNDRIVSFPSAHGFYGGRWSRYGYGTMFPVYDDVRSYSCEATFTLNGGVVERVVYGGAGSAGDIGQCYSIVQNCLAQRPPG